jgi:hypothetical protein
MSGRSEVRSRRTAAVLALVALLAVGGCGVPGSSKPTAVSEAPGLAGSGNQPDSVALPSPAGVNSPSVLVERFLQSGAAADWDPARLKERRIPDAVEYAKQFLAPALRQTWRPDQDVLVVDPLIKPGLTSVEVDLRPVGVLDETGSLDPLPPQGVALPSSFVFQTELAGPTGDDLLLTSAPNFLMLSLTGLEALFEVRPVYFWDKAKPYLVPDRRYVSKGISDEKRVKAIIDQLVAGPSDFLRGVVAPPLVEATTDNPLLDDNRVTVNFATPPLGANPAEDVRRLASQIRWSVHRPSGQVAVEVQFDGRTQLVDDGEEYLRDNPALPRQGRSTLDDDRLLAVLDGKVLPVFANTATPRVLDAAENAGVVTAAVNRANGTAALVRPGAGGMLELWVRGPDTEFRRADLPPIAAMSRPSYVAGTNGRLLIVAGGALYSIAPDGTRGDVRSSPNAVTAVSVAPDGARVALVTNGQLVVAPLDTTGGTMTIGTTQPLYLGGLTDVRGIGWLFEHRLVVATAGPQESKLTDVAIDNGFLDDLTPTNLGAAQLSQVSAVPGNPIDGVRGSVVVETTDRGNRQAFYTYDELTPIPLPPSATPSPAPSASTSPGTTPVKRLVAPFFADDVR